MNIIIIEDEPAAVKRLSKLLLKTDPSIKVLASLEGVEDSVKWFMKNDEPDLVFLDIQLSDGLCFEIFEQVKIESPIIFTTAYNEYAIQAFKLNSIDYLLKPIEYEDLLVGINKFKKSVKNDILIARKQLDTLLEHYNIKRKKYKSRFLIKANEMYFPISCNDVSYICVEDQLVRLVTKDGKKHVIDHTLDELEGMLDPDLFYRINRQMIVKLDSVKVVQTWFNSRLKLNLSPQHSQDVIVSRSKVRKFMPWFNR